MTVRSEPQNTGCRLTQRLQHPIGAARLVVDLDPCLRESSLLTTLCGVDPEVDPRLEASSLCAGQCRGGRPPARQRAGADVVRAYAIGFPARTEVGSRRRHTQRPYRDALDACAILPGRPTGG